MAATGKRRRRRRRVAQGALTRNFMSQRAERRMAAESSVTRASRTRGRRMSGGGSGMVFLQPGRVCIASHIFPAHIFFVRFGRFVFSWCFANSRHVPRLRRTDAQHRKSVYVFRHGCTVLCSILYYILYIIWTRFGVSIYMYSACGHGVFTCGVYLLSSIAQGVCV